MSLEMRFSSSKYHLHRDFVLRTIIKFPSLLFYDKYDMLINYRARIQNDYDIHY